MRIDAWKLQPGRQQALREKAVRLVWRGKTSTGVSLRDPNDPDSRTPQDFTGHTFAVARRAAALQIGPLSAYDLGDCARMAGSIDMKARDVFPRLGRHDWQAPIQDIRSRATIQHLTRARRRHAAKLFRADRHQRVPFLQFADEFLAPFRRPTVPPARYPEKTRADQHRRLVSLILRHGKQELVHLSFSHQFGLHQG